MVLLAIDQTILYLKDGDRRQCTCVLTLSLPFLQTGYFIFLEGTVSILTVPSKLLQSVENILNNSCIYCGILKFAALYGASTPPSLYQPRRRNAPYRKMRILLSASFEGFFLQTVVLVPKFDNKTQNVTKKSKFL